MQFAINDAMKQKDLGLDLNTRRTRKKILLDEMEQVMPWGELLALITPHAPVAKTGRPPFDLAMMLRIPCLQQWFGLSDLGAEEALFETGFLPRLRRHQRHPAHPRPRQHPALSSFA